MAQNTSNHPSFSPAQRQNLKILGLRDVEINELEIYLPLCRAILGRAVPMQNVRDEIKSLHSAMKKAHSAMSKLGTYSGAHGTEHRHRNDTISLFPADLVYFSSTFPFS